MSFGHTMPWGRRNTENVRVESRRGEGSCVQAPLCPNTISWRTSSACIRCLSGIRVLQTASGCDDPTPTQELCTDDQLVSGSERIKSIHCDVGWGFRVWVSSLWIDQCGCSI